MLDIIYHINLDLIEYSSTHFRDHHFRDSQIELLKSQIENIFKYVFD